MDDNEFDAKTEALDNEISVMENGFGEQESALRTLLTVVRMARTVQAWGSEQYLREAEVAVALHKSARSTGLVEDISLSTRYVLGKVGRMVQAVDPAYESLDAARRARDERWIEIVELVEISDPRPVETQMDERLSIVDRAMGEIRSRSERTQRDAETIADAKREAAKALTSLKRITTQAGTASLEGDFRSYSIRHAWMSGVFLVATIVLLGVAVFVAVDYIGHLGERTDSAVDLTSLLARLSVVSGLAAIAAYTARQAAQHRRRNEWAAGIVVQLRSFRAFIEELRGAQRDDVYAMFARRVLGEPPSAKSGTTESGEVASLPVQAVVELLAKTVPRATP